MRYLLLLALAGCPDRTIASVNPTQSGEIDKDIPVEADVDILFVIDNSASTHEKQQLFAQNFPRFVQALDAFPLGRPNLHIGVVSSTVDIGSSDFGTNCHPATSDTGLLQNTPRVAGCSPPTDRYIRDVARADMTRDTNYAGTLQDALSCIAQLGDGGCGFEAQLEGMKRALDGSRPENAGFLRDNAFLAVVILTDEDDCSIADPSIFNLAASAAGPGDFRCQPLYAYDCDTPISPTTPGMYNNCKVRTGSYLRDPGDYYSFLTGLKGAGKVVVALIGGDPESTIVTGSLTTSTGTQPLALEPSCMATIGGVSAIGRPAIRLSAFQQQFGDDGIFRTVCQSDYSQAVADIGALLIRKLSRCLEGNLVTTDSDPGNPGTQLDCTVSDVTNPDTAQQTEVEIPACAMTDPSTPATGGARPCWWTKVNPTCGTTSNIELEIERNGQPPPGTSVRVRCAAN